MRRIGAAFEERSDHDGEAQQEELSRDSFPVHKLKLLIVAQTLMFISLNVCIDQGCGIVGKIVVAGGFVFSLALFLASGADVHIVIDKFRTFYLMRKAEKSGGAFHTRLAKPERALLPASVLSFLMPLVFMMAWVWVWRLML